MTKKREIKATATKFTSAFAQKLGGLKAMGMPLPEDLVRLEWNLGAELDADMGYIL